MGNKEEIFFLIDNNEVLVYSALLIKPYIREVIDEGFKINKIIEVISILEDSSSLNLSLNRVFVPAQIYKKNNFMKKEEEINNELLYDFYKKEKEGTEIILSLYLLKISKNYEINSLSFKEIEQNFTELIQSKLKEKILSIGKVGRLTGNLLENVVKYCNLDISLLHNSLEPNEIMKMFAIAEKKNHFNESSIHNLQIKNENILMKKRDNNFLEGVFK